ncbi:leucyl/phenylalanyl-tRNA--protein transferase [Robbsia sp. KACC 23696]|uniref:leucyl/phenylalanyl-tRNA--protein transferase n=1 Tax=Robbsia sp. KACC 23696 TaxID=3149231 RepID=UPI00325BF310
MITWLTSRDPFPPLHCALGADSDAPGLLAASAELTPERLKSAYGQGIFPWYSDGQPVLWWSPDPRMVLVPGRLDVSRSFRKTLRLVQRDPRWEIRIDVDFSAVMRACAQASREGQDGTWITEAIVEAYSALHRAGFARSVETWYDGMRVGGLYCVAIGRMCFGESMFAERSDASKIALAALCAYAEAHAFEMIDCQQNTQHLHRMGAREISREAFVAHLARASRMAPPNWRFDKHVLARWTAASPFQAAEP